MNAFGRASKAGVDAGTSIQQAMIGQTLLHHQQRLLKDRLATGAREAESEKAQVSPGLALRRNHELHIRMKASPKPAAP